jgi:hypothetical protein
MHWGKGNSQKPWLEPLKVTDHMTILLSHSMLYNFVFETASFNNNAYSISVRKSEGKTPHARPGVDGRIILKYRGNMVGGCRLDSSGSG